MTRYSVLIPERDDGQALADQIERLHVVMRRLVLSYEIICLDDGSDDAHARNLEALLDKHEALRVIRFDHPVGLSAALSVGISAARGEIVIVIEPGTQYHVEQIPHLISRLSRGDLVMGRRLRSRLGKAWERVARAPRWLLLGLDTKDPDCLFWAARREAVAGLDLAQGMFRFVPTLVSARGYRVCELEVDTRGRSRNLADARPNPFDLLAVWWLRRRLRPCRFRELTAEHLRRPHLKLLEPEGAAAPVPLELEVEHGRRESA